MCRGAGSLHVPREVPRTASVEVRWFHGVRSLTTLVAWLDAAVCVVEAGAGSAGYYALMPNAWALGDRLRGALCADA